jgi:S-sulfosulfanyl-L-cysteine sulfohydrolase
MSQKKLTIIQLTDVHAYLEPHPEVFWENGQAVYRQAGGYAAMATYLKKVRAENEGAVLALDCGDTFHGTYPAIESQGEVLVPILNSLGLAAMTAHWEFAYGPQQFKKLTAQLNYPMLAINIYNKTTRELVFKPYRLQEVNGLRIGIIGIACNILDKTMPASFSEGLYFTLGREELPGYIRELKETHQTDLIVLISHLGFPQNMKLLAEVAGVDVCLSGHTHYRLSKPVRQGKTLVIESGCHGSFLGHLEVTVADKSVIGFQHTLIEMEESLLPDKSMAALVKAAVAPARDFLAQKVGETTTALDRSTSLESTMDNFLLESLLAVTRAEVAFSNGWRYGAPILPGDITRNDLYNIIPMNPEVRTVTLRGEEIKALLEENLERTFSGDAYQQLGGYVKRALGLRTFIKIEAPAGNRIQQLFINNMPLLLSKDYRVAYVTEQGVPARMGQNHQGTGIRAIEALQRYLRANAPLSIKLLGTFTPI